MVRFLTPIVRFEVGSSLRVGRLSVLFAVTCAISLLWASPHAHAAEESPLLDYLVTQVESRIAGVQSIAYEAELEGHYYFPPADGQLDAEKHTWRRRFVVKEADSGRQQNIVGMTLHDSGSDLTDANQPYTALVKNDQGLLVATGAKALAKQFVFDGGRPGSDFLASEVRAHTPIQFGRYGYGTGVFPFNRTFVQQSEEVKWTAEELPPGEGRASGLFLATRTMPNHFGPLHEIRYYIDPDRGYSIVRIENRNSEGVLTGTIEVEPAEVGRDQWFPASVVEIRYFQPAEPGGGSRFGLKPGDELSRMAWTFQVESINEPLDTRHFSYDALGLTDGAQITRIFADGSRTQGNFYREGFGVISSDLAPSVLGAIDDLNEQIGRIDQTEANLRADDGVLAEPLQESKAAVSGENTPTDRSEERGVQQAIWLVLAGVVLLAVVVGMGLWRRSASRCATTASGP